MSAWGIVAGMLAAAAGGYALHTWLRRVAFAARRRRGRQGEREAEALLRRRRYRVLKRQPARVLRYSLDRRPIEVTVRGDLLVQRGRRRYLAEVKTGARAPRLETAETRRQLLEYGHAFDVDGVLLVDADRGTVQRVGLPRPPKARGARGLGWIVLLAVALCAAGWFAHAFWRSGEPLPFTFARRANG